MKQETLEEVAKEFSNNSAVTNYEEGINVGKYQGFIQGAKWQQERSYSEEEVLKLLLNCPTNTEKETIEWFEQFKKK